MIFRSTSKFRRPATCLLLACLATAALADDAPEPAPVSDAVVAASRASMLHVTFTNEPGMPTRCYNAVAIHRKGWFVVPLDAVSFRTAPMFHRGGEFKLKFKKVRAISTTLDLAIVELQGSSLPALKLAPERTRQWDPVALVWKDDTIEDVIHGPVLSQIIQADQPPNSPTLDSLGMYAKLGGRPIIHRGSPVMNADGQLAGILIGTSSFSPLHPSQILSTPSTEILKLVKEAEAGGLSFPLKGKTPYDDAFWEYWTSADDPVPRGNIRPDAGQRDQLHQKQIKLARRLLGKYPDSRWAVEKLVRLKLEYVISQLYDSPADDPNQGAPANESALLQEVLDEIKLHQDKIKDPETRFKFRMIEGIVSNNSRKVLKTLEAELKPWGDEPPASLLLLLTYCYDSVGDEERAGTLLKRMTEISPDCLPALENYRTLLVKRQDWAEEARISDLIYRVERAYRPQ